MPLFPAEILQKRYRIVSLLGQGQLGVVYRAWDTSEQRDVAIKEYLDPDINIQRLFRSEARRLTRLNHPQLPAVLDHFALENIGQYLVSDYIPGVDLRSLLSQYGPLPSDLVIGWLQQATYPLGYLHENNQLHLNIKPANIRLTPAGDVFLVDTGLPGLGMRADSSGYAAPELQGQRQVSKTSDIYSLGATLYTLLTDRVPPDALRRESGLEELLSAREAHPDVEPYLSIVANRALSLRPDARYDSVADFSQALERPSGRPAPQLTYPRRTADAAPPTGLVQLPDRLRRQMEPRTIWTIGAIIFLFLMAAIVFGFVNRDQDPTVSEAEATATIQSAVIAALTAIAPTPTPLPQPTELPTPTPEPFLTETGARMLYMPSGIFRMGDDDGPTNAQPSHLVRLDAFFIDESEVTNGQYTLCVNATACTPPAYRPGGNYHPAYYGDPAFDDYPVAFVNWSQAQQFCEWRGARLPSEAEWEKAAGFDPAEALKLRYPWGDTFDGTQLNFCDRNCPEDNADTAVNDGHKDTAPVGSYPDGRSPIGLYDMAGNVAEWVGDWYNGRFYTVSTDVNPRGPLEGEFRVTRGGSWLSSDQATSTVWRDSRNPQVALATIGFRCAMTAP